MKKNTSESKPTCMCWSIQAICQKHEWDREGKLKMHSKHKRSSK